MTRKSKDVLNMRLARAGDSLLWHDIMTCMDEGKERRVSGIESGWSSNQTAFKGCAVSTQYALINAVFATSGDAGEKGSPRPPGNTGHSVMCFVNPLQEGADTVIENLNAWPSEL